MNYDVLKRFPSQLIEKRPTECVGETIADILGNIADTPMDAGFSYAAALKVMNVGPTTNGSDPYAGMLGGMIYGVLPTDKVPFDVSTMDELYESNWANYDAFSKQLARQFTTNGIITLNSYKDITDYLSRYKVGVCLGMKWYESFNTPNQSGSLPPGLGSFSNHCVAVYEDDVRGLRIKPWLGPDFGDGGYVYLTEANFNLVREVSYGFNPLAWRWMSLARTAVARPWLIGDILPELRKEMLH